MTTEHFLRSGSTPGMRHRKYECNISHWFGQICSALVLVLVASTLAVRSRSKLNRCETTSRRWFSLMRFKSLIRISWCSVNARMGAKPVSLRIKSASVNGVLEVDIQVRRRQWHGVHWFPLLANIQIVAGLSHGAHWRLSVQCWEELLRDYYTPTSPSTPNSPGKHRSFSVFSIGVLPLRIG